MKNTSLKKQFSNILLYGLLCIILTSCENFIDGGNIKQKLETDITYAKAEQFYIKVGLLKNEHGQITPSNEELYRVSDKINIEFTLSSSYTFNRFRIIDKDSKIEDTSQAVTLSEVTESTNGLIKTYKTTASVNFIKQNLMILPDCYLTTDTVAPQFYSNDTTPALKIARNKSDIDNGIYIDNQEITDTSLNWLWSEEECQARHVSSLYIKASIKEEDSSTVTICVKENFFADAIGSDGSLTFGQIEPSRTETVELNKISDSTEGIYIYEGEYKFQTDSCYKKFSDGLLRLEFTVKDSAGNESQTPVCFYVIKDTFVDVSKITLKNTFPNYNDPDFSQDSLDQYKTFFVDYSEAVEDNWAFYTTAPEDFTYRLKWGPDENNLKTTDAFDLYYNPQVYENCFGAVISDIDETVFNIVRLEVTDKAGAVGTIEKLLPPRPELINVEETDGNLTLNFLSQTFNDTDLSKSLSCTLIEYQSEDSCFSFSNYSASVLLYSWNVPYLDKDFVYFELDGLCGPVLNNLTYSSFSESSELTVPSFKLEVNNAGDGSGLYRVTLTDSKTDTPLFKQYFSDEISYIVCVSQESENKRFFKEDSFLLNYSPTEYKLKVIAEKNGETAESEIYTIKETQTDNKAPEIRMNDVSYRGLVFNNKNIKEIPVSCIVDDNSFGENVSCTIHYSDYNPGWSGTLEIFDQAQVLSLPSFNISLIPDSNTVYSIPVPVKNLKEDGNYLITIDIHDKLDNILTQTIGIAHVETVLPPVITKFSPNSSEKLVTCKLQDSSEMERQKTYELLVYYWENNEWTLAGNSYTHNEINSSTRTGSQVLDTANMPAFVKTFLYAYSEYNEGSSSASYNGEYYTSSNRKNEAFSAPVYKFFSESEIECFSKAIIETNSKTVILNDKPAFVHLVSACADYGNDVARWERFGDFYDEAVINPNVTGQVLNTYEPDLSKVPQGEYYVIIAWFADGTSDISSVHKKSPVLLQGSLNSKKINTGHSSCRKKFTSSIRTIPSATELHRVMSHCDSLAYAFCAYSRWGITPRPEVSLC